MSIQHKNLEEKKWFSLTLPEQLGNVGSEYGRALSWKKKENTEFFDKAFVRALELMDLTLSDFRWKGLRLRELCRLRNAICYELTSKNVLPSSQNLEKYFLQFGILARSGRPN